MKCVFLRPSDDSDKGESLRAQVAAINIPRPIAGVFIIDLEVFRSLPGSPFPYWANERTLRVFKQHPAFESSNRTAKHGAATLDDFRFLRTWWEISAERLQSRTFVPFAKGGSAEPFFVEIPLVVKWGAGGTEIKSFVEAKVGSASRTIQAEEYYFRPGITWPLRAGRFCPQVLPAGGIFSLRSSSAFVPRNELAQTLALMASLAVDRFLKLSVGRLGHPEFTVGVVQGLPWPLNQDEDWSVLAELGQHAWHAARSKYLHVETSRVFRPPSFFPANESQARSADDTLRAIQAEIDKRCFRLYRLAEADLHAITEGFGGGFDSPDEITEAGTDAEEITDDDVEGGSAAASLACQLVSWAVGVACGRFDVRLATGARALPAEPEPFEPLPACSPAMLTGNDGLPLASAPVGYPCAFPENGILADDPGSPRDMTGAVRAVFDEVFSANADARWNEAADLLDPNGHDLRAWLGSRFFEHHLKSYSKSRRKAPIVWQLGTPSARYSVWLYAHRLTRDSFFQIQNDVVASKLGHEERQLTSLMQVAGGIPSAKERKEIAAQETFVGELRAMLDEVKRVTPLWNPSLDDGVVITMSPLWRLVPQHKPWQNELKSKWDELAAGKYDWAHIAMHLWPERIVPKCATDRSLAIAHGLEDVFWIEGEDGKWGRRSLPTRSVEEVVNERTSPAVKAALKSLLEAPLNAGTGGKGYREATVSRHGGDE